MEVERASRLRQVSSALGNPNLNHLHNYIIPERGRLCKRRTLQINSLEKSEGLLSYTRRLELVTREVHNELTMLSNE